MLVSGDALLRTIRASDSKPSATRRGLVIYDWTWRHEHRRGTIICDLPRRRVLDLLPD